MRESVYPVPSSYVLYGKDRPVIPLVERLRNGQVHNRTLSYIESRIAEKGQRFSFIGELKKIASIFEDAPAISVLDGGCGEGNMLADLKSQQAKIGKFVETTGVTMEPEQEEILASKNIDTIFIGSVQEYYERIRGQKKFHFIIDSSGAAYHDFGSDSDGTLTQGETIIPIYTDILYPKGRAFLTFLYLNPYWGASRRKLFDLLERNNLDIIDEFGDHAYLLVEKRESSVSYIRRVLS
ncbi:MAG: hypothetical protein KatS3mg089_0811 [Patescibacteria group bacterium]|nr:MAG: hypothetical protein KatS3mg089_0811 [Patescibacteria group bacterium]